MDDTNPFRDGLPCRLNEQYRAWLRGGELTPQPRDQRGQTPVVSARVVGEEGVEVLVLGDRDKLELRGGDAVAVPGVAPERLLGAARQGGEDRAVHVP